MTAHKTITVHPLVLATVVTGLVAAGALATWLVVRSGTPETSAISSDTPGESTTGIDPGMPSRTGDGMAGMTVPADAATITLDEEVVRRAGIRIESVAGGGSSAATLQVPGVIEPDGYRTVVVTPLVGGRITDVRVALGDPVRRGATLARMFSPDLAMAQTRYISDRAALDAHEQEVARTGSLVAIGAASREELERVHAAHAAHRAAVAVAASRLELLGWAPAAIESLQPDSRVERTVDVPAPIDGVVTGRQANVGLNVEMAAPLFTVVDLSRVWAIGEVYERDLSRVRVGSPATVTSAAFPDLRSSGRVTYIDPAVDPETRTVRVRVEIPNPDGVLRLGLLATIRISVPAATDEAVAVVPAGAVQQISDRTVVYVADPGRPGTFVERVIRIGVARGETVPVLEGVSPGEHVVTDGSFLLRAERERLGLPVPPPTPASAATPIGAPRAGAAPEPTGDTHRGGGGGPMTQDIRIVVTAQGFEPARVVLRAGVPARLTFVRTTDATCATEVVIPALNARHPLPLNEEVVVTLPPRSAGEIAFACGMDMLRGAIVAR